MVSKHVVLSVQCPDYLDYFDDQITKHPNVEKLLVWRDGCGVQDRNATLLSVISSRAQQQLERDSRKIPRERSNPHGG